MRKKLPLPHIPAAFLWAGVFCLLGVFLRFGIAGFSFSGMLCFGVAAIILSFHMVKVAARRWPKMARFLQRMLTLGLCLVLIAAILTGIPIARSAAGDPNHVPQYLIVLGAGVNGTVPSLALRERLDAAYDYLTAHPEVIAIVTGGQGNNEDITEALCMYNDLTARGIAPSRVWMEEKATSTKENIAFSLELIEEVTGSRPQSAGVLSNEYHLYRAGRIAKAQGLQAIPVPARTRWVSLYINYFLREIAAVWYYTLFGGFA